MIFYQFLPGNTVPITTTVMFNTRNPMKSNYTNARDGDSDACTTREDANKPNQRLLQKDLPCLPSNHQEYGQQT